jgi:hypothetical protein
MTPASESLLALTISMKRIVVSPFSFERALSTSWLLLCPHDDPETAKSTRPEIFFQPSPSNTLMSPLDILSWISISLGVLTAAILLIDVLAHPQEMWIMNIVWPVTGLYFPLIGFWLYRIMGRPMAADAPPSAEKPHWQGIFVSATHCGSGCVIGDILGAPIVFGFGFTLFGAALFAEYVVEFVLAYVFGIAFQFFAIRSMRRLSAGEALRDAIKADTLALVAFELGMFAWMAISDYVLLPSHMGPGNIVFWFMMQIGMVFGFLTSYPANWLLIRWGIKSPM